MFIYSGKTPIYIPMLHRNSGYISVQNYSLPCLIISFIIGACVLLIVVSLSKSNMTTPIDILLSLVLDVCVGILVFMLAYALLGLIFVR